MIIEVDFNSDEAIYIQLCNQIIMGIATSVIHEGDSLPSVRQLADTIGVNMHTVNKAYSVLKREGYISLDKRRGAVIALDIDKMEQLEEMRRALRIVLARGCCKNISRQEVHDARLGSCSRAAAARIFPVRKCMIWWMKYLMTMSETYRLSVRNLY